MEASKSRHGKTITGKSSRTSRTTQKSIRFDNHACERLGTLSVKISKSESQIIRDAVAAYLNGFGA